MYTHNPFGLPYQERWTEEQVQACVEFWNLTEKETSQLWDLKERLADLSDYWGNGPFEVTRFILEHSCHGNVDTMEKRIRRCVAWRASHQLDSILETYSPPVVIYQFPAAIMQGTDHEGDIVAVVRQGDPLGIVHRYGHDETLQSLFWGMEFAIRGPWQNQLSSRPRLVTAVIDLKGLNRRHYHPTLLLLVKKLGFSLQLHYPHVLKKVLVVNAPAIFRFVWSLFKPFIMPHLRMLMEVATEAGTEELISQYMDLSVLPEAMMPQHGRGTHVDGLDPNWDIGLIPPPTDHDWERIPLVYQDDGSYDTRQKFSTLTTKTTTSHTSNIKVFTTSVFKGYWEESTDETADYTASASTNYSAMTTISASPSDLSTRLKMAQANPKLISTL